MTSARSWTSSYESLAKRGSGFARMRDAMLNHGLDAPAFSQQDGYFVVTFPGPNGNYERLKVPEGTAGVVPPSVEAQLNERQKKIMLEVQKNGSVTTGWCRESLGVALLTVQRDIAGLADLGLVERKGKGRGARYILKDNR